MSYIERSKQNAMDKEELKAFRAREADDTMAALANAAALEERSRNQAVIDSLLRDRARTPYSPYTGIDSNEFLQETNYMANGGAQQEAMDTATSNAYDRSINTVTGPSNLEKFSSFVEGKVNRFLNDAPIEENKAVIDAALRERQEYDRNNRGQ